jgi:leucyl-tRNA synthetase
MSSKGRKISSPKHPSTDQNIDLTVDETTAVKVNQLRELEQILEEDWDSQHLYEIDAPMDGDNPKKFFVTFPYPYMNGRLHLGHLFTFSKAEFAARYHLMKGEQVLFPFGFHCTGTPIPASADKLAYELDQGISIIDSHQKGSKASAKSESGSSQAEILLHMEVPETEIPEFRNSQKWLEYFPPLGISDLKSMGACIDWRRSFITTNVNPYYDRFVQWQFRILQEKGFITFGKRPSIYSLKDEQPCMDHDRASGEGIQPQEYTLIKLELINAISIDHQFEEFQLRVFLLAATLRPETMIGQTNYWVKPGVEYDVVKSKNGLELWICGSRCRHNLAAQQLIEGIEELFTIESNHLIGAMVTHPSISNPIRGLPLPDIRMNKGTGIVTSVPSDAPHDLQGILDLQKNETFRQQYGICKEWVEITPIYVIHTEKLGDFAAKTALDSLKTTSLKKEDKLEEAKNLCYKEGFYHGIMIEGPFIGEKVSNAKEKMKELMIEEGSAIQYWEPEDEVISRSGDHCVVVLCDQWYIEYGQEGWKSEVVEHFNSRVEVFHEETREKFRACFDWLSAWPCSRQYGLGTRLPFDDKWLIDSLSDSTIYNAYYTIAHLLQSCLDGSKPGIGNLTPDEINDEFFDYVFRRGPLPEGVNQTIFERCRREFEFWYPVDCRVSGKDLVTNHLTMYLYNHIACIPKDKWPIGIRANGHLKLNGAKMAKSTGNFLTGIESIRLYSASGLRIGLADSGDGADDANFDVSMVKSGVARLTAFIEFVQNKSKQQRFQKNGFADELFDARLSRCVKNTDAAYSKFMFRAALKSSFFELQNWWTEYLTMLGDIPVCAELRERYIETFVLLNAPIIPQWSDYIWRHLLGHHESVCKVQFPEPLPYDPAIFYKERLLSKTADTIRFRIRGLRKVCGSNIVVGVWVITEFNEQQRKCLEILRNSYDVTNERFEDDKIETLLKTAITEGNILRGEERKEWMPFLQFSRQAVPEFGTFLLDEIPTIDQLTFFQENEQYFLKQLPGCKSIQFFNAKTTLQSSVPAGLWDEGIVNQAQVYIPSATVTLSS